MPITDANGDTVAVLQAINKKVILFVSRLFSDGNMKDGAKFVRFTEDDEMVSRQSKTCAV